MAGAVGVVGVAGLGEPCEAREEDEEAEGGGVAGGGAGGFLLRAVLSVTDLRQLAGDHHGRALCPPVQGSKGIQHLQIVTAETVCRRVNG